MTASELTSQLIMCRQSWAREQLYRQAEADYGKGFADHLRDQVEAHHLILDNKREVAAR